MANENYGPYIVPPSASSNGGPLQPGDPSPGLDQLRNLPLPGLLGLGNAVFDPGAAQTAGRLPMSQAEALQYASSGGSAASQSDGAHVDPNALVSGINAAYATDPTLRDQADDLRDQHDRAVNPVATAYDKLLASGAPQYQAPQMSPWLAALGAGLGALQNSVEPYNQTGAQNWVQAPIQGAFQGAQDRFQQARDAYGQNLQNAQSAYALAKDRNQGLLDQADAIDKQIADQDQARRAAVTNAIFQTSGQNFELAKQRIDAYNQSELQKSQQDFQSKMADIAADRQRNLSMIDYFASQGNTAGLAHLYVADYLHGHTLDENGNPLSDEDRRAVAQIQKDVTAMSPGRAKLFVEQRILEEHLRQEQIATQRARWEFGQIQQGALQQGGQFGVPGQGNLSPEQIHALATRAIQRGANPKAVHQRLHALYGP